MKFEELDIHEKILEGITAAGFSKCTPVQAQTLPLALEGKDIAAQSQTGTGKTAAFLIAIFSRMLKKSPPKKGSPRVLIIAPTRELVLQIEAEAKLLGGSAGFSILAVFGGIDYIKQRDEISKGVDVLIGTPGRLIDYLKQRSYHLKNTEFLVIDEADRMFNMGFISDLRFMLNRMSPYDQRQSMLFSATLSHRVLELCYEHMNMPVQFSITPEDVTVRQIEQSLYHVGKSEKFGLLLGILRREHNGHYMIFCNTKVVCEKLKALLTANKFPAETITGDLPQNKRIKVLSRFKDGSLAILVATDVASRGLHIDGVTHVINYDLPMDPEDYVHRIGRTARAGAEGKATSLVCEQYVHTLVDVEEYIKQKLPVGALTDDMIVTDYRRASFLSHNKGTKHGKPKSRSTHAENKSSGPGTQKPGQPHKKKIYPTKRQPAKH